MHEVEKIEGRHGIVGRLFYDEDASNPREENDNVGFMVTTNNRYFSIKEGDYSLEELENVLKFRAGEYEFNWDEEDEPDEYTEERDELIALSNWLPVILPLYMYAHGGVTISTGSFSCPWDSGQIGYIYTTGTRVTKEFGGDLEATEKCLEAEVKEMAMYLEGDVYGYIVEDVNGDNLDSCWGFYGLDYALEEMKGIILWHEQEIDKLEWKKQEYHI